MILALSQITDILKSNPNKKLIDEAVQYTKTMKMHLYGKDLRENLELINGFEKTNLRELRVKYTKSNKDLFSRVSRPLDKVFSARGGSIYYNLPDSQDTWARQKALNIRDGYSVKKWVETFWKMHFLDDPNGFIFMEVGDGFAYPTYKSITTVYDYQPSGNRLDYIVFEVTETEKKKAKIKTENKVFRVVDDLFDYYVTFDGTTATILQDYTYPNYFFSVPAILNSDIVDPNMDGKMLSLFDEAIELASQYLLKGSIKVTHDFLHGFPKYAEFADQCTECAGTGSKGADVCPKCKGAGATIRTAVSDNKLLRMPETKDDPIVLPANTGAYISPDKTYYEISSNDMSMLESAIHFTIWGKSETPKVKQGTSSGQSNGDTQQKTATEVISDDQPMIDRLMQVSEMAEARHKFIIDHAIKLTIQSYPGANVNYGKRFGLEGPDALWEKYSEARIKGAPTSMLDDLLTEYLEAKYGTDPVSLSINLKLKELEPFVHNTASEVKDLGLSQAQFYQKVYFGEWLATKNDAELLVKTVDALRVDLKLFVDEKLADAPTATPTPAPVPPQPTPVPAPAQ